MFVYGFGSYLVFMEIGCGSRSSSAALHTSSRSGMSWWFLADVVIRVPVQVSSTCRTSHSLWPDNIGVFRRKSLEDGRSEDVVPRYDDLPIVSSLYPYTGVC